MEPSYLYGFVSGGFEYGLLESVYRQLAGSALCHFGTVRIQMRIRILESVP
jgi:hypothetical protein